MTAADLLARIEARSETADDGCLIWAGPHAPDGYGRIHVDGRARYVHRVAHQLRHGDLAAGVVVRHLCTRKDCLADEHLAAGTQRQNVLDTVTPSSDPIQVRKRARRDALEQLAANHPDEFRAIWTARLAEDGLAPFLHGQPTHPRKV